MTKFVNFGLFEKNSDDSSKPHSLGPKGSPWRKKTIPSKNSFSPTFLDLKLNFLGLLAEKLAVWPNFHSLCPEEHFEENNVFRKFFFVFQTSSEYSSDIGQKFWLRSLNGILVVQRNNFRNFLLKFDQPFCHFQSFWRKMGRLSKLHSIIPEDRLVKKVLFK